MNGSLDRGFPGAPGLLGKRDQQDGVRDRHSDRHDCAHEGLNIQSCARDQEDQDYTGDDRRNRRQHDESKAHRLKIRR